MNEKTIIVDAGNGPVQIDAATFDPEKHKMISEDVGQFLAGVTVAPSQSETQTNNDPSQPVTPATYLVQKSGKKFMVVDQDGVPAESDKFEAKGYNSEAEAWQAITDAAAS